MYRPKYVEVNRWEYVARQVVRYSGKAFVFATDFGMVVGRGVLVMLVVYAIVGGSN